MLSAYNPPGAAWPGLSQAVGIRGGGLLVTSGITATDAEGNVLGGDFESQVEAVYANIGRVLGAAGVGFDAIARIVTYVVDYEPGMIPIVRKVRSRFLSAQCPPASVLIGIAALYDPRLLIEVEVTANLP